MRICNVLFASVGLCGAALFFACGDASFSATGNDGGSEAGDGSTGDGSIDGHVGRDDGGPERIDGSTGTGDAACVQPSIVAMKPSIVACPSSVVPDQTCDVESGGTCCFEDGEGSCNASGVCATATMWQCEKGSDCAKATCCLVAGRGDSTACPENAPLTSSSCASLVCPMGAQRMCVSSFECTDVDAPNCQPLFVQFSAGSDAGAVVGVCVH